MSAHERSHSGKAAASDGPALLHITTIPMSLTFLRGQVGYMKERGFRVHAVSSPGPDLVAFGRNERIPVHAVEMPRRITPWRDVRALAALLRVLHQVRPTIVHAHTPKGGLLGMIAATLSRTPVRIYHVRGLPALSAAGLRRRLLWRVERIACSLAHLVLCVSHSLREEGIRQGLCPAEKITVLAAGSGNGVDAKGRFNPETLEGSARAETRGRLGIPPDATVIGFVGRVVRDKGIVELTEAWEMLRGMDRKLQLLLVGPFEPQDAVPPEIAVRLREDPRVHLVGMDWNTPPLYAAMDLVALPTHREGFPNVPLEAAAMGIPVVATRIPGCVDAVLDGVTGTLVPAGDADTLAGAIEAYVRDPALRRHQGAVGRERVLLEFEQEMIWEALHREYHRLLGGRGLSAPVALPLAKERRSADG
jgi:glycosyltransferase involved in cell wall biosynthesis